MDLIFLSHFEYKPVCLAYCLVKKSWELQCASSISVVPNDLYLFCTSFPDQDIRRTAVQQIENLSNDELLEYLPQLVQVRKQLIAKEVL